MTNIFDEEEVNEEEPLERSNYISMFQCESLQDTLACICKKGDINQVDFLNSAGPHNFAIHVPFFRAGIFYTLIEYCMGGSLRDYLSIPNQSGKLRQLDSVLTARMLKHVGSALDFIFTKHRMVHGCISERSILIQIPQVPGLPITLNFLSEAKKRCHDELESGNLDGCVFKLTHFENSCLVPEGIAQSNVRKPDIDSLASVVISNSAFASEYLKGLEWSLSNERGYTVKAVLNHLRQYLDR